MHVIHIGPDPQTIGGMQSVLRTIRDRSVGAERISILPTWGGPSATLNGALVARATRVILAADKASVVHVHLSNRGAYLRDPPLAALARARGMRVVLSLHGDDFPVFARRHPRIVRAALAPAHHVTCLSEDACAAARGVAGPDRVTLLANPIAIDRESPPASETEPVILFAGVVGRRKGVDFLVDAWRALLQRGIDGRCRIIGPIDDFRPPSLDRLTVEGPADPESIPRLIRSARLVVLPSRSEGMPMILTEAAAARRPFVATPVGDAAARAVR